MEFLVARQPIFDRQQVVFGYEILYRSSTFAACDFQDADQASLEVIGNTFLHIGFNRITNGRRAFLNFTRNLFLDEVALRLPRDLVVIEVLENIEPSEKLLRACRGLKEAGYLLALDDFVIQRTHLMPLLQLVDIVKVDCRGSSAQDLRTIRDRLVPRATRLLAEKVETQEEFRVALEAGYDYFQGFFFSRPVIVSSMGVPGYKLNYLRFLQQVHREDLEYAALEGIIGQDLSLSYKLLNYMNSAFFGLRQRVSSIRHALTLLGDRQVRNWASLVALTGLGQDKPQELLNTSLVRAIFCEALAPRVGLAGRGSEAFLTGLFSLLEALIGRPLGETLADIPLHDEIKTALLGGGNRLGMLLELVLTYEAGDWAGFSGLAARLDLDERVASGLYLDAVCRAAAAMQWSDSGAGPG